MHKSAGPTAEDRAATGPPPCTYVTLWRRMHTNAPSRPGMLNPHTQAMQPTATQVMPRPRKARNKIRYTLRVLMRLR